MFDPKIDANAAIAQTRGLRRVADDFSRKWGESVNLNLDAEYSDGSTRRVTAEATWTSSNDHVASVRGGIVTARNLGGAHVRAAYAEMTVQSIDFRVERGAHVTVRNVRMERASTAYDRVKGTVINSGTKTFSGFLSMHARFYSGGGLLLADNRDYVEVSGAFPVDAQRTFNILVRRSDVAGWSYYTLAFLDGNQEVECAGCDEQRRN